MHYDMPPALPAALPALPPAAPPALPPALPAVPAPSRRDGRPPVTGDLRLVGLGPADTEALVALLEVAYGRAWRRGDLTLFQQVQPDGWYAMAAGTSLVAAAGAISYGPLCWIGSVATHPGWQRRGLARRLTEHLVSWAWRNGAHTVALDASDQGEPVYRRLGFTGDAATVEYLVPRHGGRLAPGTRLARPDDLPAILAFDEAAFGCSRAALLGGLLADPANRCLLAEERGTLRGYLVDRADVLGPGAALTPGLAVALVSSARTLPSPADAARLMVPVESDAHHALDAAGLPCQRALAHLRVGRPDLGGARHRLFAQTSFGAG